MVALPLKIFYRILISRVFRLLYKRGLAFIVINLQVKEMRRQFVGMVFGVKNSIYVGFTQIKSSAIVFSNSRWGLFSHKNGGFCTVPKVTRYSYQVKAIIQTVCIYPDILNSIFLLNSKVLLLKHFSG